MQVLLCAAQLKLATVGFSQVGMSDAQADFFAEHFAGRLAEDETVRVATKKDMAAVLGIEKQRQLLGCGDEASSCMAELAGALGADGIVTGQLAKVGKSYQLNLKILAADGSRALYIHNSRLLGSEEELIEELNDIAAKATRRVREHLHPAAVGAVPEVEASSGPSRPRWRLLPAVPGVVALGVGVAMLIVAAGQLAYIQNAEPNAEVEFVRQYVGAGKQNLGIGLGFAIAGAVAVAGGVLWYLLGGSPSAAVSIVAGPDGGALAFGGRWP